MVRMLCILMVVASCCWSMATAARTVCQTRWPLTMQNEARCTFTRDDKTYRNACIAMTCRPTSRRFGGRHCADYKLPVTNGLVLCNAEITQYKIDGKSRICHKYAHTCTTMPRGKQLKFCRGQMDSKRKSKRKAVDLKDLHAWNSCTVRDTIRHEGTRRACIAVHTSCPRSSTWKQRDDISKRDLAATRRELRTCQVQRLRQRLRQRRVRRSKRSIGDETPAEGANVEVEKGMFEWMAEEFDDKKVVVDDHDDVQVEDDEVQVEDDDVGGEVVGGDEDEDDEVEMKKPTEKEALEGMLSN